MELANEQYREIVRHLSEGVLIIDKSGDIQYESPDVQRITGYEPEERVGRQVFEHVHPDDQQQVRERFSEFLTSEDDEIVTAEFRYRHEDGSWIWLEMRGRNPTTTAIGGYVVSVRDITETKEREKRLKQTTNRLEALFESSPDMIDIHTDEGTIVDVNQQFCEAFNQPKDELVGQKVWDIDQEIEPEELRDMWDGMDVGDRTKIETEFETSEGTRFPVEVHLTRLPVEDGDQFMVISRDITERKERIQEIETLKERLELAVEGANLGVWDWDMTSDEVEFNDQWAEMLGYTLDELDPHLRTWETRVHPDDLDEVKAALDEHIQQQTDYYDTEHRMRTADGEWKWIRDLGKIVERDEDGEPIRAVGIHLDIDDSKQYQRELEQARRQYEELFDGMNDTGWVLDPDGSILAVNEAAVETLGYSREELLSMNIHDIDAETPAGESSRSIEEIPEDVVQVAESTHETKDGDEIPIEISSSVIPYEDRTAILSIARDISARKQREKQLEQFASIVSHDLRNPLSVAEGNLELAQEECDSEFLEKVARAHDRMDVLIGDLLTLAREGNQVSEMEEVDLPTLAEDCWQTVETPEATLQVETDRQIRADRSRLAQLLENLIRNAIEHGGETVTVTIGDLADGFYVADDGPGIPPEERDEVFEIGHSTTAEGTGFGLGIAKQIAEAHGWDINLATSTNGGLRVEILDVTMSE